MDNLLFTLIVLILGWLLGLLTLHLSEFIRWRFYEKKILKEALIQELKEFQVKFIFLSFQLTRKYFFEITSEEFLRYQLDFIASTDSPNIPFEVKEIAVKSKNLSYEEVNDIVGGFRDISSNALSLKKVYFNLSVSKTDYFIKFSPLISSLFTELFFQLNSHNQDIELYNNLFRKTFDGDISEVNMKIIDKNMVAVCHQLNSIYIFMVEIIDKIIVEFELK